MRKILIHSVIALLWLPQLFVLLLFIWTGYDLFSGDTNRIGMAILLASVAVFGHILVEMVYSTSSLS